MIDLIKECLNVEMNNRPTASYVQDRMNLIR
jgi:hypothetical protein